MKIKNLFKSDNQIEPMIKYEGIAKYMPLIICGGFYLVTVLLFAFGPFEWNITNEWHLYGFLTLALIALIAGYLLGVKLKRKTTRSNFNINHIIYVSFIIFIIIYVLNTYATTGDFFPNVIRGLFNSGEAYSTSHMINKSFVTIINYLGILIAPVTSFLIPLFFMYFKNLSLTGKILGIITLILNLCTGIAQGVINAYAIIAFQIIMFLLIFLFSNFKTKTHKQKLLIIVLILLIGFSFIGYYKLVMGNRLLNDAQANTSQNNKVDENIDEDKKDKDNNKDKNNNHKDKNNNHKDKNDNSADKIDESLKNDMFDSSAEYITQSTLKEKHIFSILPDSIESNLNHITSYITHGYKGLSLAMDKEFTSSYGLGFSDFFRHNLLKVIGKTEIEDEIYARTYMKKIEVDGWANGNVWSTFFIYPASDIGFTLTLLVVFIIGYIFSIAWRDSLESKNIFSTVIFINLCMVICFFCANNVYFQNGGPFLTIVIISILWFFSRIFRKEKK